MAKEKMKIDQNALKKHYMNHLKFIIILCFLISCKNEKEYVAERYEPNIPKVIIKNADGVRYKYEYYETGNLKYKILLKDSLMHGSYDMFFKDGKLMESGSFYRGLQQDTAISYFPSGKIKNIRYYIEGKMKVYRKYDTFGNKISEINDLNEKSFFWFKNGNLSAEVPRMEGNYFKYYENGGLKLRGYFEEGKKSGEFIHLKNNGDTSKVIVYREGTAIDSTLFK